MNPSPDGDHDDLQRVPVLTLASRGVEVMMIASRVQLVNNAYLPHEVADAYIL
jgi:hypothetical protein